MKNIILSVIVILIGMATCVYAAMLLLSGNLEVTGKYSPEGRDFNTILLMLIIGVSLLIYGFFCWFINRPKSKDKK